VLLLIAGGVLGFTAAKSLVSAKPALMANQDGIRSAGVFIPWISIAALEITEGGIPVRLKLHVRLQAGHSECLDLSELNVTPREALRRVLLYVEHYRPDLFPKD
jgi:hypothetical protein